MRKDGCDCLIKLESCDCLMRTEGDDCVIKKSVRQVRADRGPGDRVLPAWRLPRAG